MIDLAQQFFDTGADLFAIGLQTVVLGRQASGLGARLCGFFDGRVPFLPGTGSALMSETLPSSIRQQAPLDLGTALSETEALAHMRELASQNEVFASLIKDRYNQYLMLDSTLVRAHQQAATGKGGAKIRLWGAPEAD